MNRLEEIKKRHNRHKRLREFGRSPAADVSSNKELDTLVFETKHIMDKVPDDIEWLIEEVERLKIAEKALDDIMKIEITQDGQQMYMNIIDIRNIIGMARMKLREK